MLPQAHFFPMSLDWDGWIANLRVGCFCVPVFVARSLTCLIAVNGIVFFFFPHVVWHPVIGRESLEFYLWRWLYVNRKPLLIVLIKAPDVSFRKV